MAQPGYAGAAQPKTVLNLTNSPRLVSDDLTDLWGYEIHNQANNEAYIQLFDKASTDQVTLGTTKPDYFIPVQAAGSGNETADKGRSMKMPLRFRNGLVIASTTGIENSDGTLCDVALDVEIG